MTTALGLDIGGANLKAADPTGMVCTTEFPMWKQHHQLADRLQAMSWIEHPDLVGVTMTAELADCFAFKADGVGWVIDSVQQAFPKSEIRIWLTTGEFADPGDAVELPELVAAANWHALATWVGRAVPHGPAILLDVGSTTTDMIPLLDGLPMASGLTDLERLQHGQLVYTGVRRTPLCAVRPSVVLDGLEIPVAAELFATTLDIYLVLGSIAETPDNTNTADGHPATVHAARRRISRMLCCDRSELGDEAIGQIARQFANAQCGQLTTALQRIRTAQVQQLQTASRPEAHAAPQIILSGSGEFLAEKVVSACDLTTTVNLRQSGSSRVAEAACAFAIARLVFERCRDDLLEVVPFYDEQA